MQDLCVITVKTKSMSQIYMKPTVWMMLKSLFIIPEICIYQSRNTVVFDYPRKYLNIPEICSCQNYNTIIFDYPRNI